MPFLQTTEMNSQVLDISNLCFIIFHILQAPLFQIRDFQLVGQWAEGLKGILSPPGGPGKMYISTSKKHQKWWKLKLIYFIWHVHNIFAWEIIVINLIDFMNIQEVNSTKILSKYTFTH